MHRSCFRGRLSGTHPVLSTPNYGDRYCSWSDSPITYTTCAIEIWYIGIQLGVLVMCWPTYNWERDRDSLFFSNPPLLATRILSAHYLHNARRHNWHLRTHFWLYYCWYAASSRLHALFCAYDWSHLCMLSSGGGVCIPFQPSAQIANITRSQ